MSGEAEDGNHHPQDLSTHTHTDTEEEENAYIPWPTTLFSFPLPASLTPTTNKHKHTLTKYLLTPAPTTTKGWAHMATTQSLGIFIITLLISAIDTYTRIQTKGQHTIQAQVWFQGLVAAAQLNIILSLTRTHTHTHAHTQSPSIVYRALTTPFAEWLGKISMNVYLIHYPLLGYFCLARHPHRVSELLQCSHTPTQTQAELEGC
jgi:peptidoglycan/LPS O-acetylase OafA/YrhL